MNLPMFHVGGTSSLIDRADPLAARSISSTASSTDRFWDQVRRGNCTTTSGLIGIMGAFLMKSPPRPDDREHPIRCMTGFPVNEQTVRIRDRFGIDYLTGFNMTELSAPLVSELNSTRVRRMRQARAPASSADWSTSTTSKCRMARPAS